MTTRHDDLNIRVWAVRGAVVVCAAAVAWWSPVRSWWWVNMAAVAHVRDMLTGGDVSARGRAEASVSRAVEAAPDSTRVRLMRGRVALRQGDTAGAVNHLREVTRRDPSDAQGWFWLGQALDARGDVDDAVEAWRRAGAAPWWGAQAAAAARQGDTAAAIAAYARAVKIDPHESAAWTYLARVREQAGDVAGLQAAVEGGLAVAGEPLTDLYRMRSDLRFNAGDLSGALDDAREAARRAPTNGNHVIWEGDLLLRLGRVDEAAQIFRALPTQASGNWAHHAHERLAKVAEARGLWAEAEREYAQALEAADAYGASATTKSEYLALRALALGNLGRQGEGLVLVGRARTLGGRERMLNEVESELRSGRVR